MFEACEINVHKNCIERVRDTCLANTSGPSIGGSMRKKRDKPRQSMVLNKFISRKSSANSPAASMYLCYVAVCHSRVISPHL